MGHFVVKYTLLYVSSLLAIVSLSAFDGLAILTLADLGRLRVLKNGLCVVIFLFTGICCDVFGSTGLVRLEKCFISPISVFI